MFSSLAPLHRAATAGRPSFRFRRALVALEQLVPAAVHAGVVIAAHRLGLLAEPLEVAMLEIDESVVAVGGEADLDHGFEIGIVGPFGVELPGEQHPVRRLPGDHPAPFTLAAVIADLVPAAAVARLDHHVLLPGGVQAVALHPPAAHAAGEGTEGLVLA